MSGAAPETHQPRFLWLLVGASAAPRAWLGQVALGFGVSAYICYPGDHPVSLAAHAPLFAVLMAFDVIALGLCIMGAWISWFYWRRGVQGRNRMLALWGLMSSLWFLAGVLFNIIASLAVPPCIS
jgi:hypothetical protein